MSQLFLVTSDYFMQKHSTLGKQEGLCALRTSSVESDEYSTVVSV